MVDQFNTSSVELRRGSNAIYICNATAAGNSTLDLHWGEHSKNDRTQILPSISSPGGEKLLSAANLTRDAITSMCQERSGVFYLPLATSLLPNQTTGAIYLHLKAALLICKARPSLSKTYSCFSNNISDEEEYTPAFLTVIIPLSILEYIMASVVIVVLVTVILVVVAIWIFVVRYRSVKDAPQPMIRQNSIPLSSHRSSMHRRHSFTNPMFHLANGYTGGHETSPLEFSREKLHLLNVLGKYYGKVKNFIKKNFFFFFDFPGEGQFGQVWKATAEGICPHNTNRCIVAVKTTKRMSKTEACNRDL